MNFRTTLLLSAVLAGLAIGYLLWRPGAESAASSTVTSPVSTASAVARDVLDEGLGDIVKIACRREGEPEMVFERQSETDDATTTGWRMTSPAEMKAVRWEVDRISRQLTGLQYEVSHKPDDPGSITASKAGLSPPALSITLTDANGRTSTVEIGKPASSNATYVRLAGGQEIYVGKASLRDLVKPKPIDYRDKELWSFKPDDVTRVEIVDRSDAAGAVTYAFARDGARWMMESPTTAKATSKVDEMLTAFSRLRAIKWHDDQRERLVGYGLDPAVLTVRVTVEEEVKPDAQEAADEDETQTSEPAGNEEEAPGREEPDTETEQAPPEPEKKVTVYELHLSSQSPIGEDTKAYIRAGDEPAVATIMKTVADKLKPTMSEWREMRITTVNVAAANRIELSTSDGSATLVKRDGQWSFDADAGPAEESVVKELLDVVADLKAVAFVDGPPAGELAEFGLDEPRARIALTVPGVEDVERIAVGGYTDAKSKRLVYVRRNDVASVAKVRAAGVKALMRGPRAYRDRTVFDVPADRIEQITLSTDNRFADGRTEVTLKRGQETWKMSSPAQAAVRQDRVDKLAEALGGLRAESIVADAGQVSAYGLHAPAATIAFAYKPAGEDEPPSQSLELAVTDHDGKIYAKQADRAPVYELARKFYNQLFIEYRTDDVLAFDDSAVRQFAVRKGDVIDVFDRVGERWTYASEPDLPLDAKKVENLLLQLKDLRTERYVTHVADDLARYGLVDSFHEVKVTLEDGSTNVLRVSNKSSSAGPQKGFYATVSGRPGVFLLSPATVNRFAVSLTELEAED